jgi:hypothetical protein
MPATQPFTAALPTEPNYRPNGFTIMSKMMAMTTA